MSFFGQCLLQIWDNVTRPYSDSRRPYMLRREQLILEELIDTLQPRRVLEWGAGYSTLYFPSRIRHDFEWISVESNSDWYTRLLAENRNPSVLINLVDEQKYESFPKADGIFDLIIIDGVKREECMKESLTLLAQGGIVFLHDANRISYRSTFDLFPEKWILLDYRRSAGGLAVFSKGVSIKTLINCEKHELRWSLIRNTAAKVLAI